MSQTTPLLRLESLSAGYKDNPVIHALDWEVYSGQRWAVIGQNGCGKSTLLKSIAGLLPFSGVLEFEQQDARQFTPRERARFLSFLPQKPEANSPFSVEDFTMMARHSRMNLWGRPTSKDRTAVENALESCDLLDLRNRSMDTLSGGELQRVLLAGSIAQDAKLILLDEPTTYLDPAHENLFLQALADALKSTFHASIFVSHSINSALSLSTHILSLSREGVVFCGNVEDFRSDCPEILEKTFGIPFEAFHGIDSVIYGSPCHASPQPQTKSLQERPS